MKHRRDKEEKQNTEQLGPCNLEIKEKPSVQGSELEWEHAWIV